MSVAARPSRLPEIIADRIQAEILDGGLEAGAQLPTEPQLSERYDVSRTVVREAARILEQRGLVRIRPGRGMTVERPSGEPIARHYALLLRSAPTAFDELMDVRMLLETSTARYAATHRSAAHLVTLESTLAAMEAHPGDYDAVLDEDLRFHSTVGAASGNSVMTLLLDPINACLRESYRDRSTYLAHIPRTIEEHRAIHRAIRDGDADAAQEAMRRHLERVREFIL